MKGLILAAGESKRLRPLTNDIPKCLLNIGGQSIIDYQIKALINNKVSEIVVVVGYMAESIMKKLTTDYPDLYFKFIYNPIYSQTNTVYSLWLASRELDDDVIYFNADVLTHPDVINRLVKSEHDTCLANNRNSIDEEAVKMVIDSSGRITEISKQVSLDRAAGEAIGIAKYSKKYNELFAKNLTKVVKRGDVNNYFESAIEEGLKDYPIYETDVSDLPIIEIDFPEDLEQAKKMVTLLNK